MQFYMYTLISLRTQINIVFKTDIVKFSDNYGMSVFVDNFSSLFYLSLPNLFQREK